MKRIGMLCHPKLPQTRELATALQQAFLAQGADAWTLSAWDSEEIEPRLAGLDLLVTLGGDGTILRAARLAAPHDLPILSINFGRVGFLTEVEPNDALSLVPRIVSDGLPVQERMMLHAEIVRDGRVFAEHDGLNDVFVGRGARPNAVRLKVWVMDEHLSDYRADGIVAATATGSTAYALSSGGPVIAPELRTLLLAPVAPHVPVVRAFVFGEDARIEIELSTDHEGMITVDGQVHLAALDGDRVVVTKGAHPARFVKLHSRSSFYRTLVEKLR